MVADIVRGTVDGRGEPIDHVFFKRTCYAIYKSGGKVVVQYADEEDKAVDQIAKTSPLIPLRDQLQYLVAQRNHPTCYLPQIAEALRLGLEDKPDLGAVILNCAIADIHAARAREGRLVYLGYTVPIALLVAAALIGFASYFPDPNVRMLLQAAGSGAVGALLSIIIAIRTRTVALDGDRMSNILDGTGRLLIGVISAAALFLLLTSGLVAEVKAGGATLIGQHPTWQIALIIGFAAGFLERLVPDLLNGSDGTPKPKSPGAAP